MLPELFAMLASDLFLLLSLMTCLLDEKVPKALPYVFQVAALSGFGHLLISRIFFIEFDVNMRFWYNVFYLGVALTNIVAVNAYLAFAKKEWKVARLWSSAVTFPTIAITLIATTNYGFAVDLALPPLLIPALLTFSLILLSVSTAVLLGSKVINRIKGGD